MTRELSEIHRICGGGVPDLEIQSIIPGQYITHTLSHLVALRRVEWPQRLVYLALRRVIWSIRAVTAVAVEYDSSCDELHETCYNYTVGTITSSVLHHIARRSWRS
jgi:hypothetical protein